VKYLLDTDTCIQILRGVSTVTQNASAFSPDDLAVSSVTRYELIYGSLRCASNRRIKVKSKVELFLSAIHEIPFSSEVANEAAEIRRELEIKGQMIGPMDLLIAATARQTNLEVVTGNMDEFSRVKNLHCSTWG